MKLGDIEVSFKIPEIPKSIPVFETSPQTFDKQMGAIENLGKMFGFGKTHTAEVDESIFMVAKEGIIQFYRPSGAIWARNLVADSKYEDERRSWKTEKMKTEDDYELVLPESLTKSIADNTRKMLSDNQLIGEHSYFADISLDQVCKLDESGKEIARYPGEATVRFLYRVHDIPVDGGGAKSYVYINPTERGHEVVGIYNSWRDVSKSRTVNLMDFEKALSRVLKVDKELHHYYEKKYRIRFDKVDLVYYTLPPFKHQSYLFPVYRISGSVSTDSKEEGPEGFEFSKYYHAIHPKDYLESGVQAHYLLSRL